MELLIATRAVEVVCLQIHFEAIVDFVWRMSYSQVVVVSACYLKAFEANLAAQPESLFSVVGEQVTAKGDFSRTPVVAQIALVVFDSVVVVSEEVIVEVGCSFEVFSAHLLMDL
jgi:hypothetical protein